MSLCNYILINAIVFLILFYHKTLYGKIIQILESLSQLQELCDRILNLMRLRDKTAKSFIPSVTIYTEIKMCRPELQIIIFLGSKYTLSLKSEVGKVLPNFKPRE